ncbi:DUF3040 domain-containing protein [Cumulibacter soli]|uniref:DUF3040 domain-containing protein n=1 Tax=Cumulibacter soli TaxID=2546344 RepID=UPI001419AD6A|nr:DUF3040 domain-containing protein [Cumulibacter soli]
MPLSEHEQRVLEQIERSLYAEDPKFRAAVKKSSHKPARIGSLKLAIGCGVLGLVVLVGGVWLQNVIVGVLGFLIMLIGGVIGVRVTQNPPPKNKDGKSAGKDRGGSSGKRSSGGGGVADKAQERMRRRFEGGQ